jgi:hypothetical protein
MADSRIISQLSKFNVIILVHSTVDYAIYSTTSINCHPIFRRFLITVMLASHCVTGVGGKDHSSSSHGVKWVIKITHRVLFIFRGVFLSTYSIFVFSRVRHCCRPDRWWIIEVLFCSLRVCTLYRVFTFPGNFLVFQDFCKFSSSAKTLLKLPFIEPVWTSRLATVPRPNEMTHDLTCANIRETSRAR